MGQFNQIGAQKLGGLDGADSVYNSSTAGSANQAAMNFNYRNRVNYHFQKPQQSQPYQMSSQVPTTLLSGRSQASVPSSFFEGGKSQQQNLREYGASGILPYQRNETVGNSLASQQPSVLLSDPRTRKMAEREERIRREKEELAQLQAYNPFGKGGAGAPMRDMSGNTVSNRRPYSQVRDPEPKLLHSSHSNQNLPYVPTSFNQRGATNLNQSVDIGTLSKTPGVQVSQKITRLESQDQREERQKKQLEYQEVLRIQMEEKKAKEEEVKRKKREDDMREEMKIREEIEKEKQLAQQEKLKKEQKQNTYANMHNQEAGNSFKNKSRRGGAQSPEKISDKFSDANGLYGGGVVRQSQQPQSYPQVDMESAKFQFESSRQLDLNQMSLKQQPPFGGGVGGSGLINTSNQVFLSQMEKNFQSELFMLKNDMKNQQMLFESQLHHLKEEAQKNIDYRVKAEQELERLKIISQREKMRPKINYDPPQQQAEQMGQVRRSMMNLNGYEKLFFGGGGVNGNPLPVSSAYGGGAPGGFNSQILTPPSQVTPLGSRQGSTHPTNFFAQNHSTMGEPSAQGLGGKFEGSQSLKAESVFVPVVNKSNPLDTQKSISELKLEQQMHLPEPLPLKPLPAHITDKYDGDMSLNHLENAINEISELNMGEHFKQTQIQLQKARVEDKRPNHGPTKKTQVPSDQPAFTGLPEYKGLQSGGDPEINILVTQFHEANQAQAQFEQKQKENQEMKMEYLQRSAALESIFESSNEQTFPSGVGPIDQRDRQLHQQHL